jgi:ABC-type sugar transport system ATPase subunit
MPVAICFMPRADASSRGAPPRVEDAVHTPSESDVRRGDIFFIIGGSGCGKTTLLRHLIGLNEPAGGEVWYGDVNFTAASDEERERIQRRFGILFQKGALWTSMTLAENVGLPLEQFTPLAPAEIDEAATLNLSLVGLRGFEDYFLRDQRRHAEARGPRARDGARPGRPLLRRAVRRSRSRHLASARRPYPVVARQPRSDRGHRVARAIQHPGDRR